MRFDGSMLLTKIIFFSILHTIFLKQSTHIILERVNKIRKQKKKMVMRRKLSKIRGVGSHRCMDWDDPKEKKITQVIYLWDLKWEKNKKD